MALTIYKPERSRGERSCWSWSNAGDWYANRQDGFTHQDIDNALVSSFRIKNGWSKKRFVSNHWLRRMYPRVFVRLLKMKKILKMVFLIRRCSKWVFWRTWANFFSAALAKAANWSVGLLGDDRNAVCRAQTRSLTDYSSEILRKSQSQSIHCANGCVMVLEQVALVVVSVLVEESQSMQSYYYVSQYWSTVNTVVYWSEWYRFPVGASGYWISQEDMSLEQAVKLCIAKAKKS